MVAGIRRVELTLISLPGSFDRAKSLRSWPKRSATLVPWVARKRLFDDRQPAQRENIRLVAADVCHSLIDVHRLREHRVSAIFFFRGALQRARKKKIAETRCSRRR